MTLNSPQGDIIARGSVHNPWHVGAECYPAVCSLGAKASIITVGRRALHEAQQKRRLSRASRTHYQGHSTTHLHRDMLENRASCHRMLTRQRGDKWQNKCDKKSVLHFGG